MEPRRGEKKKKKKMMKSKKVWISMIFGMDFTWKARIFWFLWISRDFYEFQT